MFPRVAGLSPAVFACACTLSACGATTSSKNIRTAALVALIDITCERPDQTVVSADMVVGGRHSNTHVVLEDGDHLVASCEGERHEMSSVDNGSYAAQFARSDGEFVVSLRRASASFDGRCE